MFERLGMRTALTFFFSLSLGACSDTDETDGTAADGTGGDDVQPLTEDEAQPVIDNYAALVHANYEDALAETLELRDAVFAFTADPTEQTHQAAKDAWLQARDVYGQTESFRFYGGPIDNDETGPEGQINAWPMDESYVDYVEGMPEAGIINDPSIEITKEMLAGLNEQGGEENVATGYHAIEFLLWGQDLYADGPGQRTHEDFVDGGPAANPDRRRLYLETVAELLVDDLTSVTEAWIPDAAGNYRAEFVAKSPDAAIQDIMRGIGALAGAELSEERMNVAMDTRLQEDEHSCFSDNTHRDILANFLAIKNVYLGDYGSVSGDGIDTLIETRDAELATQIQAKLEETEALMNDLPVPFDQAIEGDDQAQRQIVLDAIDALRELSDLFVEGAAGMGLTLNTALE